MKTSTTCHSLSLLLFLAASSACSGEPAAAAAKSNAPANSDSTAATAPQSSATAARELEPFRQDLLALAFRAASALPVDPHKKTRCKVQESVALACLDLDQPALALEFGKHIGDWRRGSVFADYAFWCSRNGDRATAEQYLQYASQIAADVANDSNPQEWRRDTIEVKVARVYALLGDAQKAAEHARGVAPTSGLAYDPVIASTTASRAELVTADTLDAELSAIDDVLIGEASGQAFAALMTCTRLYEKFFADAARRAAIEKRIRIVNSKLPPNLRLGAFLGVVKIALAQSPKEDKGDTAAAAWRQARDYFGSQTWTTEARLAFVPQLAELRHRIGEPDAARGDLEAGLQVYHENRSSFRGTKRAEILRPYAEAYHAIGDAVRAGEVYALVVEEGVENPNSRPRAEDIAGTCVSMAKHGFQPDARLLARLREVTDALGDPW